MDYRLRSFVGEIAPKPQYTRARTKYHLATVVANYGTSVDLQIDGSSVTIFGVPLQTGATAFVGSTVSVLAIGPALLCLGTKG